MQKKILVIILIFSFATGCQKQQSLPNIAFSRLTSNYWQIWTMNIDGSETEQLTASPSDKRYPAWSKDGRKLLFRDNNNRAFVIDLITGEEKQILQSLGLIGSVIESPTSGELLLVRFKSELMDSSDLWVVEIDDENRRILTRDIGLQYDPAWSPNGKKIAYISGHGFQTHELYIMDSNGKNKMQRTTNKTLELLPAFSPDGQKITYVSDITGDFEVWVMDIDGRNTKRLTDSEGIDTRPCWSPDGDKIIFVSSRSGELQLWIMDSDGSDPQQLTTGAPSMDPAWKTELSK